MGNQELKGYRGIIGVRGKYYDPHFTQKLAISFTMHKSNNLLEILGLLGLLVSINKDFGLRFSGLFSDYYISKIF